MKERNVAFLHMSKKVNDKSKERPTREVLQDVSGFVDQGQIMGILGASGSGKTTLIDVLGGRNLHGVTGEVYLKGEKLVRKHRRAIAYVTQECVFFDSPHLTIRDHLLFSAAMRFDITYSSKMRQEEVDGMLCQLHLSKCADLPLVFVSGGERKRCSIGCELFCPEPLLLLLDEATSGLDSATARNMVSIIRSVAERKNVPTIMSIHGPNDEIFTRFDKVLFLSEGRVVYDGCPQEVMSYLRGVGFSPINGNMSVPDFMLSLLCTGNNSADDYEKDDHEWGVGMTYTHSTSNARLDLPNSLHYPDCCDMTPSQILIDAFNSDDHLALVIAARDLFLQQRIKQNQGTGRRRSLSLDTAIMAHSDKVLLETKEESSVVLGTVSELTEARRARHFTVDSLYPRDSSPSIEFSNSETDGHKGENVDMDIVTVWVGDDYVSSFDTQFRALLTRSSKQNQSVRFNWLNLSQTIILALIIGLAWFNMPFNESRLQDLAGLLFFTTTYIFFAATFSAVLEFLPERAILKKERESKLYHLSAYYLSKCVATLPLRLTLTLILFSISYNMAVFSYVQADIFFALLAILLLLTLVGESVGMLIGTMTLSFDKAIAVTNLAVLGILLTGGFYVKNLPTWLQWLKYTSPLMYGYASVLEIHLLWSPPLRCDEETSSVYICQPELGKAGLYIVSNYFALDYLDFEALPAVVNCLVLILFLVALRIATYLSLRYLKLNTCGRE